MKPWRWFPKVIGLKLINTLIVIIPVLINVAFLTLLERKILGLRQSRKGPNKVSLGGVLQPFADAIKLFTKESIFPLRRNLTLFLLSPSIAIALSLIGWSLIPLEEFYSDFSLILLLIILGLGLYPLLLAGWASNSSYALTGGLRGVAQTISYEIRLAILLISFFFVRGSLRLNRLNRLTPSIAVPFLGGLSILWLITALAETNRTPFDFAEGESELVSGFNIEYGAVGFALIFIAEYAMILLLRVITSLLLGAKGLSRVNGLVVAILVRYFWVWARATLPRYRYDILMSLAWKAILPVSLGALVYYRVITL